MAIHFMLANSQPENLPDESTNHSFPLGHRAQPDLVDPKYAPRSRIATKVSPLLILVRKRFTLWASTLDGREKGTPAEKSKRIMCCLKGVTGG
jgi:hypothetical protein